MLSRWLAADPAARPPDARQSLLEIDDLLKMMSSSTVALPGRVVPAQGEPLASQPGQAPLRAAGLAAAGAAGSAFAGPPGAPGLAPPSVAPDYLEVIHTPPPQAGAQAQEAPQPGLGSGRRSRGMTAPRRSACRATTRRSCRALLRPRRPSAATPRPRKVSLSSRPGGTSIPAPAPSGSAAPRVW